MKEIITKNHRICRFYEENPSINFEAVNLIFIDLFEKLLSDINSTMNVTINSQILSNVTENSLKISELNTNIMYLKDTVNNLNQDITNNILSKFIDIKKDYVDEIKMIIQNNISEKIGTLLEKTNNSLIDKTTLLISDIIPKTQNHYYTQIQESIRSFHKSISDDTRVLLKYIDNNTLKEYIHNFDMKSSMMMQNLQQPIYTFISASEERIISNLKDNSLNTKIMNELSDFLNNYRNFNLTDVKNNNQIHLVLNKLYPTSEVISLNKNIFSTNSSFYSKPNNEIIVNSNVNMNVYIIKIPNKPKILIQSIDIDRNVNADEIRNFMQNIEENNCSGIFISQRSGFSSKPNYFIEIFNKSVIVYIHNTDYSSDKIRMAVDIIENITNKLKDIHSENEFEVTIDKEILEEINKEYQLFITQKESIVNVLKDSQKKIFTQIEDFKFPALDKYLSSKFAATIHKQGFKCDLCKAFNANNLKALAAHKRGCSRKNIVIQNTDSL